MSELVKRAEGPTLFEKMLKGQVAAHFILNSELLGVAAILDVSPSKYARGIQAVVFPYQAIKRSHWDMKTRMSVAAAIQAIDNRIEDAYEPELIVEHAEGYGVPDHGHVVLLPSFARGESAALHDPERTKHRISSEMLTEAQAALQFSEEETLHFEIESWRGAHQIARLL